MTTYYKYRVRCTTDNVYRHWILAEGDPVPSTCPDNTSHTINTAITAVVDTFEESLTQIKEENIPTGGNFRADTINFTALANTVTFHNVSYPFPITALTSEFVTSSNQTNDTVDMMVGIDTITGAITGNIAPATTWISQNYTVGNIITYTHPLFGNRVYTCIADTVSNENPTDSIYWKHGYEIPVSQTVIDNAKIGYEFKVDDLTNSNDVERVIGIDKINNKIYVEKNITNSFSALSPTYMRQTVYILKNYIIGEPWEQEIGTSKIGGSHVPTDTLITIKYNNTSTTEDVNFVGRVEFLY